MMRDEKKWNLFEKAENLEKELRNLEAYKIFENFLGVKRTIFNVRYNYNQYCKHSDNFERKKLIYNNGIKRWHHQNITGVLICNYFSSCYSLFDIMEFTGFENTLKDDSFIKLSREIRNFILHREILPITNNERRWKENDQIYFKSEVTTPSEKVKQYLYNEKSKMKTLIEFFENKSFEILPLSDIIIDLKNEMESIFADFKFQFVLTNKEALKILKDKYKEISQLIIEADMTHNNAVAIKYRYLKLLLHVYSDDKY